MRAKSDSNRRTARFCRVDMSYANTIFHVTQFASRGLGGTSFAIADHAIATEGVGLTQQ
jgi:hypothetical protein